MHIPDAPKRLKLMVLILKRGEGDHAIRMLSKNHNHFNLLSLGEGTANTAIMDYLGLTDKRRDVVFSVLREEWLHETMDEVRRTFHLDEPGNGIAFTIPINSVGGLRTLHIIASHFDSTQEKDQHTEGEANQC